MTGPSSAARADLFPAIDPNRTGMLPLDGPHVMYWEESGNPEGLPVVVLHGGPGSGSAPRQRQYFDPKLWRIVVFDQRGAGKSVPTAEIADNTATHLIADMERLRTRRCSTAWSAPRPMSDG